jgi:hypothetical protein
MLPFLNKMKHSPVRNYGGIPGLTSWLIGAPSDAGMVRLMECSREHQEPIIPHSHRFDFHCQVLAGRVRNLVWSRDCGGDEYEITQLVYSGAPGKYESTAVERGLWAWRSQTYMEGDTYSMGADEVHSIFFERGTSVLFFEGPQVREHSIILQPVVDGEVIPTFRVEPWMFKKGGVA